MYRIGLAILLTSSFWMMVHATDFRYKMTRIPSLPGHSGNVTVRALNDLGHVVGASGNREATSYGDGERAFLYHQGVSVALDTPAGMRSDAVDLNDRGEIIGLYYNETEHHSFLYSQGTLTELGMLVLN